MHATSGRLALSLADLEVNDPGAGPHGRERRFLCPLPACAGHQQPSRHRSLAVNVETGAWICHRCGAAGLLRERWTDPRERARIQLHRAFHVPVQKPVPEFATAHHEPAAARWREMWDNAEPGCYTQSAQYVRGRGIDEEMVRSAGLRHADDWLGRPAVLFPLRDRAGRLVAVQGRYLDGRTDPKARTIGPKLAGAFWTSGAFDARVIVVTEAPIDALSLAACGIPAVALCGTSGPDWLAEAVALRAVALALDADKGGDRDAQSLAGKLQATGARVKRWRPAGAKDWNALLMAHGADALRAALTHV